MNKRGSLELSIQAIVIVVIAFVVLGLGLGFVRTQFKDISSTSTQIQSEISQQILDELRTGNKKLSFPATQLSLETNSESVQAIGIKNTKDTKIDLKLSFQVKSSNGFQPFVSETPLTFTSSTAQEVNSKIVWDDTPQPFKAGESKVIPITITAPDKTGNYLYKVVLNQVNADGSEEEFESRTFFIKTSWGQYETQT